MTSRVLPEKENRKIRISLFIGYFCWERYTCLCKLLSRKEKLPQITIDGVPREMLRAKRKSFRHKYSKRFYSYYFDNINMLVEGILVARVMFCIR